MKIWTLILSNANGVALLNDESTAPPDVFVIPDDFDEDPVVLMDDDDDEAKMLLGILNMDGMPDE